MIGDQADPFPAHVAAADGVGSVMPCPPQAGSAHPGPTHRNASASARKARAAANERRSVSAWYATPGVGGSAFGAWILAFHRVTGRCSLRGCGEVLAPLQVDAEVGVLDVDGDDLPGVGGADAQPLAGDRSCAATWLISADTDSRSKDMALPADKTTAARYRAPPTISSAPGRRQGFLQVP